HISRSRMRARPSALLFGRIQVSLTRPFSSRTLTAPMLPPAWGSGMVKYSPLNHLPSSVLMQIGNGPAILTLSVTITSIHLKSSTLSSGPSAGANHSSGSTANESVRIANEPYVTAGTRAAEVRAHDGGFGGGAAAARPKRRFVNPSNERLAPRGFTENVT